MRQYRKPERLEIVKRFKNSGLSICRFATQEGLSSSSLRRWVHKSAGSAQPGGFVPVVVRASASPLRIAVDSRPRPKGSGIVLGFKGVDVHVARGFDRCVLVEIIVALRGLPEMS